MYDTAKLEFLNIITTWLLDVLRETPDQLSLIPVFVALNTFYYLPLRFYNPVFNTLNVRLHFIRFQLQEHQNF